MAAKLKAVNSDVLRWARKRSGRSLEEVAAAFGKDVSVIAGWESADRNLAPTYGQLEKLAYKLYKAPLAVFFYPKPPEEPDAQDEFRLIPGAELEGFEPDTRFAVRLGVAAQESLRELSYGSDASGGELLAAVQAKRFRSLDSLAEKVRDQLGITLVQQTGWSSLEEAFKAWRVAVEAAGIFVFKRSFKQKKASGFCLYDERFPVIYINNGSSWSRQIFTLFHELAHLLYGASGVTIVGESYLGALGPADRKIEVACNRFAGSFLIPRADFEARSADMTGSEEEVMYLAEHYCVSREVVLRKFFDQGLVEQDDYGTRASRYNEEYQVARESSATGGDYYRNQSVYLSRRYAELALARFHEGRVSLGELAGHLGIKAKNIERFESTISEAS